MNRLDAYVELIVSEPYKKMSGWCVDVEYTCGGDEILTTTFHFQTETEAKSVAPGYWFLC